MWDSTSLSKSGYLQGQVKHVVRVSCMGADTNTASYDKDVHVSRDDAPIPIMLQHYWWGEKALVDTGLPLTVLRANFFMNHLLKTSTDTIDNEGWFSNPLGKTRNSFVCTNDIAEVAVQCLLDGPKMHSNKFYDLTGPAPQNMEEIAADLSKGLIKPLADWRVVDTPKKRTNKFGFFAFLLFTAEKPNLFFGRI